MISWCLGDVGFSLGVVGGMVEGPWEVRVKF
jgi:hypothetical protein